MRGRKPDYNRTIKSSNDKIKKESPNEGTETMSGGRNAFRLPDIKKESPNEGTETSSRTAQNIHLPSFIKKESPNEGTEKVRLEFSRALMNQFRDLHVDYI